MLFRRMKYSRPIRTSDELPCRRARSSINLLAPITCETFVMVVHAASCDFQVTVPNTAHTLDGFRQWAASDGFPDHGKISYCGGEVFVDISPERVDSHNQVKTEIGRVVGNLARESDSGKFYGDGLWITNDRADLSTEPDGAFATWETLESGRVETVLWGETTADGLELRGSPDWVLEVVSRSSVYKDTKVLPQKYHKAGVGEYWLIDARGEAIEFTVFVHQPDGYSAIEPQDGWYRSEVFGREFQLRRSRDRSGGWQYRLDVRHGD